jgi:hypothetical protein
MNRLDAAEIASTKALRGEAFGWFVCTGFFKFLIAIP